MTPEASLCGYAVEWLRSCYASQWRLTNDSTALTPGRYCAAPPDTPFFEQLHSYGSRIWTTDDFPDGQPLRGEDRDARQRWYNGGTPEVFPSAIAIGQTDLFYPQAGLDGHCGWTTTAENGASWEVADDTVIITFEDSLNCGGTNDSVQRGSATLVIYTTRDRALTVVATGRVERQQPQYDTLVVYVDEEIALSLHGTDEGLGCLMADVGGEGTIVLPAGRHVIEVIADTVDGRYHVDAGFSTQVTFDPPFPEAAEYWQGFPAACYRSQPGLPTYQPFQFSDITQPREWLRWALLVQKVYLDLPDAEDELQAYLGSTAGVTGFGSAGDLVPKCIVGVLPTYTVCVIEGTTNALQAVNYSLTTFTGQVSYAGFGTNRTWLTAANIISDRIEAALPNPDGRILLVGHSYGGALAALLAGRMRYYNPARQIDCLTIGSAIPGNRDLANLIDDCNNVRLSCDGDPVPSLPPDPARFPVLYGLVGAAVLAGWGFYDQPHGQRRLGVNGEVFLDEESTLDYVYLYEAVAAAIGGSPITPPFAHFIHEAIRRIRLTIG